MDDLFELVDMLTSLPGDEIVSLAKNTLGVDLSVIADMCGKIDLSTVSIVDVINNIGNNICTLGGTLKAPDRSAVGFSDLVSVAKNIDLSTFGDVLRRGLLNESA